MLEEFLKIALIMLLLFLIYLYKGQDYTDTVDIFKNKRLDLIAAYKVYIPILISLFLLHKLHIGKLSLGTIPQIGLLIMLFIPSVLILLLFIYIIKRPFQIQWNDLGINLESLTKKTLPIFFLIIIIFCFYIYENRMSSKIVSHFSVIKLLALFSVVLVSMAEELLFRGVMWRAFVTKMNLLMAALASSVCWSLWHYNVSFLSNVIIIVFGLFLSWTYYKSKTILVPMVIHVANNIIKILLIM